MKMYLNSYQTAKLIELGFEKPRLLYFGNDKIGHYAYTIGELIEVLTTIKYIRIAIDSRSDGRTTLIVKQYQKNRWDVLYGNVGPELCDSLFNAVVKLKEEKVI